MTESKVNKKDLIKYSSYLTDSEKESLLEFCRINNDCSQAKALPLLLKFWIENKDSNVSYQLASVSSEDLSAKKYEERLATIEDKLSKVSYDNELLAIKERLATLENMLATIADNDLIGVENVESNLVDNLISSIQKDNTAESTLSELPTMPIIEVEGENIPTEENKPVNEDKPELDIAGLLKKHKIPTVMDKPIVIKNRELLYPFFTELLGKQVETKEISKVANKHKDYLAPAELWEYLSVAKVSNVWQFTRIK